MPKDKEIAYQKTKPYVLEYFTELHYSDINNSCENEQLFSHISYSTEESIKNK